MNFNFENMNNTNEQPKQDDINHEESCNNSDAETNIDQKQNPDDMRNEETSQEVEKDIDNMKSDEEFEDEKKERLEKWDNEENKKEIIIEEKDRIERELGDKIIAENPNLVEQKNIKEILKSHDELRNLQNELREEAKKNIENRKQAVEDVKSKLNQNVDIQLSIDDQTELKTAVSEFLKTTKNVLKVKEIDYLLEIGNEPDDLGDLLETHEERKIEMEELQEIIKAIEEYKKFIEEFDKLTEEAQEKMREELGKFVKWLEWVKNNKKKLFLTLTAIGVVSGVAALVMSVGLSIPSFLTIENVIEAGGVLVAGGAGYCIYKKRGEIKSALKKAGIAVGLPIIGGAIVLDSILSSEKIEKWMESICGTSLPSWARDSKEKS